MSLNTFSAFYYGHTITLDNLYLNFDEGGGELTATLNVGAYTLTEFIIEIERALNASGDNTYTVSLNRTTRVITISADGNFDLLSNTGSQVGTSAWSLMGFSTAADKTGTNTYNGDSGSGSEYLPQFILQDHIDSANWVQAVDATVNKSAAGDVEVVTFGSEQFMQCNIRFITNITQDGVIIKTNGTGLTDALSFMNYIITKAPIEFMEDISDRTTFESFILESTEDSQNGTGFRLKELYDIGLPNYYETKILRFRVYTG